MSEFENQFEAKFENRARSVAEAEATLRLLAKQPAPEGLTARMHQRLRRERLMLAQAPERKGFWRLWLPAHRVQFAGAAVVAVGIAVSMLSVRHQDHSTPHTPLPVQSGAFGAAQGASSAFGTSAAQGHPKTLTPIPVPAQGKKKKPSAAHAAKHPAENSVHPVGGEADATPATP